MQRGLFGGLLLLCACTVTAPDRDENALLAPPATELNNTGDVDRLRGKYVLLDGSLGSHRGAHAFLTLPSGLVVYVPHFHDFAKRTHWHNWFDLVGKKVRVGGSLSAVNPDVECEESRPSVKIEEFGVWPNQD